MGPCCYRIAEGSSNLAEVASFGNFDCSNQAEAEAESIPKAEKVPHESLSLGSATEVCR